MNNIKLYNLVVLVWCITVAGTCQTKIDICDKKAAVSNLQYIQKNAKEIIRTSNDNCVLGVLDTITTLFITTKNIKYIQTLDAVCKVSDGYVSEYYWKLTERMVYKSFGAYTDFLSSQKERCMERFILIIMSTEERKRDMIESIDKELKINGIKAEKKNYLMGLRKNFI